MTPSPRILDARGLPCPQPVILARKALAEGGFATLEILVDDAASRENLLKFAAYAKCAVEAVETDGQIIQAVKYRLSRWSGGKSGRVRIDAVADLGTPFQVLVEEKDRRTEDRPPQQQHGPSPGGPLDCSD